MEIFKDEKIEPQRAVYAHFTIYEEVGHGGSASVPDGVTEAWSVDMGCVGEGLMCTEREVSICAKDSGGPYNYEIVSHLSSWQRRITLALQWTYILIMVQMWKLHFAQEMISAMLSLVLVCMLPMAMNEATEMGQKTPSA